jgi:hypothetical protein
MLTSKRKAHLIVVTAFSLGIAVGASGQYILSSQAPPAPRASTVNDVADELTRILKLDESKRSQVVEILSECQQRSRDLRDQTRPQFQAIRDSARDLIRSILSVEQQAIYNQWIKELDAKREKKSLEEGKQPRR